MHCISCTRHGELAVAATNWKHNRRRIRDSCPAGRYPMSLTWVTAVHRPLYILANDSGVRGLSEVCDWPVRSLHVATVTPYLLSSNTAYSRAVLRRVFYSQTALNFLQCWMTTSWIRICTAMSFNVNV